jgi:hypothetical protein
VESLPKPTILGSYIDPSYQPALPAIRLQWDPNSPGSAEHRWHLPCHLSLIGPAPERFGLTILREDTDSYSVRVLWNDMCLSWARLTRAQILTTALTPILRALGQDLWHFLNQPLHSVCTHPALAA